MRYYILISSTQAGSGHPTSSLSAVEMMNMLFFGGYFRFKPNDPGFVNNDRFILSKGHATPLFYALWAAAGALTENELLSYRKFESPLEGHPTKNFRYTEVATGSLGQGLSVGVGMALNAKFDNLSYRTYVLLGDSEMAEGSNWESIQLASYYKLNNLIGIIDVNRLGQRGETIYGWDVYTYQEKLESFGWNAIVVHNGHDLKKLHKAFSKAEKEKRKPTMIIAKTVKGKGVEFLENENEWHGKTLNDVQCTQAIKALGPMDKSIKGLFANPDNMYPKREKVVRKSIDDSYQIKVATRKAYGHALVNLFPHCPDMVVLDAEVSNSTYSETFKKAYPDRFFEMFIAEQNMVGVAVGFAERGKTPFVSTFASFFTRAVDQIRVSQYSRSNINFVGSHAGVSIGEDGPTQMGLEDIAIFRTILDSVVVCPADHISCEKLVAEMAAHPGICYMRTTRMDTPSLYSPSETFHIGGSKILKESKKDNVTVIAIGITLYEALKAYDELKKENISIRVIDAYSIKPLDEQTIKQAAKETKALITVEDHFAQGGLGDAVLSAFAEYAKVPVYKLAVKKMPRSGRPEQLMKYMEIDASAIVKKVKEIVS